MYEPTVLVDVDHTMSRSCARRRSGQRCRSCGSPDEEEALRLANDSPFGLSSSVWTSDFERAERLGRRIEAGAVNVNNAAANVAFLPLPFRGAGSSRGRVPQLRRRRGHPEVLPAPGVRQRAAWTSRPSCTGTRTPPARANWPCASPACCSHVTGAAGWGGAGGESSPRAGPCPRGRVIRTLYAATRGRCSGKEKPAVTRRGFSEPTPGLEPGTPSLRVKCSTS